MMTFSEDNSLSVEVNDQTDQVFLKKYKATAIVKIHV